MKKTGLLIQLTACLIVYSGTSLADDDDHGWRGRGYGHHHGHHREHYYPQPQIYYYPQPQVYYQPPPVVYQQPPVVYYPQQYQRQSYQDPRSTQGLAGGVIGSVFGYQMGNGDPIAAGLGAAAGSYIGNGMGGGW
jgi:hypothetical protein